MGFSLRNAIRRSFFISGIVFALSSCASLGGPVLQPTINGLIVAGQPRLAAEKIMARGADYGKGNYVLYHLDRGLVLQMAGDITGSITSLEKAKARSDELYTRSVTREAMTWAVNDNEAPYRPPEYERALINVFQIFNYLQAGDLNEALVEARDLDSKFPVMAGAWPADRRFEDNGFARLLSGIVYEALGTGEGVADALIAYRQAEQVYHAYYGGAYVPEVLREGITRTETFSRRGAAVVYLFDATGFSPVKVPVTVPVPLGDGLITRMEWPEFVDRDSSVKISRLVLTSAAGKAWRADTEVGADVSDIARRDMAARKALIMAKAIARPGLKYLIERHQKKLIEKKHGPLAAGIFGLMGSLYNIVTERADLRSWQSLPAQVRIARIEVPPGSYNMRVERPGSGVPEDPSAQDAAAVDLKAGQTYFFIRRALR